MPMSMSMSMSAALKPKVLNPSLSVMHRRFCCLLMVLLPYFVMCWRQLVRPRSAHIIVLAYIVLSQPSPLTTKCLLPCGIGTYMND